MTVAVPRTRLSSLGDRSFATAGPRAWNKLPSHLRLMQSADTFRRHLKTFFISPGLFRLDALALSVIATATWLAGWVAGWLSHSGIVSKPLYLSENFFDHLKNPSF